MSFTPPTDSLYKFLAIVGTILVVLSVYFPLKTVAELRKEIWDENLRLGVAGVEIDHLRWRQDALRKIIDNTVANQNKGYRPDKAKLELAYSNEEVKQMEREIITDIRDLRIKGVESQIALERSMVLYHQQRFAFCILFIGVFIGGFLASFGYRNWFTRIQIYQDKMMRELSTKESKP